MTGCERCFDSNGTHCTTPQPAIIIINQSNNIII